MSSGGDYVGLLSFFSFAFSIIAAVLAIDLYALLRTGRSGSTWRVLIIASVMFALMHALRLAELLNFGLFRVTHLSEIVELMFVMALAYAFYLQRKTFSPHDRAAAPRSKSKSKSEPEPRAPSREDIAASSKPPAEPSPDTLHTDLDQSQTLAEDSTRDAEIEDEDLEEDEEAASEWARLNGQADSVAPRRTQRVGE